MKTFPLIIFILLLPIISPTIIQSAQMQSHIPTKSLPAQIFASMPTLPLNMSKSGDQVNIYQAHSQEPAPMGVADYGISPSGAYVRESTQWLGVVAIYSLSATSNNSQVPNAVSFQLNVMLNYDYKGNAYALWVQDVADFNTQNNEIRILDNIWNASAPYANVTGVQGNGVICISENSTFYAYVDNASYTTLSLPATILFLVNVTANSQGQPVIYFWYNYGNGWVNYDRVTVTNVVDASNVYFLVDGYNLTGRGNYYDSELIIGGPGDGTSAYINSGTVYFGLFYWNGHNFQEVRNAYNFGSDTTETVSNANVQANVDPLNGALYAKLTAGSGSLGNLWNRDNTTQLTVYTPINSGYIQIYNENLYYSEGQNVSLTCLFTGGEATFTLYPMDYAVLVYNQYNELVGEANIYGTVGQNVSTYTAKFSISLSENQITAYTDETNTIGITINAYGNVTISVISPSSVITSLTQEPIYVNGETTIDLNVYPTQTGTFTVIINASIFPGFYQTQELTLNVQEALFTTTFEYSTVGQPLPQEPQITLTFPNGTTITQQIYSGETIEVPPGTSYSLQQIISEGDTRWTTPTLVSGVVNSNGLTVSATYYEQYLVNFSYTITNGQWTLTPPTVTYYSFTSEESASLPAQVWVNYNSPYYYSQNVTVGNERIISTNYEGTVTSPGSINVYYTVQYYVTVKSQIPVEAIINGNKTVLNSSWINEGTTVYIINSTYNVTNSERYVITSISPQSFTVTSPVIVNVSTVKQFLVTINGKSSWYNQGSTVTLNANISDDEVGEFIGTYNLSPNSVITVNSPIIENLVISENNTFYDIVIGIAFMVGIVVVVAAVIIVLLKRWRKGKS